MTMPSAKDGAASIPPDPAAGSLRLASATGVDMTVRIAGLGGRSYAFVIDWHIRIVAAIAWMGLANLILFGDLLPGDGRGSPLMFGVLLPAFAIYLLYHPLLEVLMRGRTPGKRMAGLRVVTLEGRTPGTGPLLVRNLLRVVDSLPGLYAVGCASVVATRHSVRIGDLAAGTVLAYDDAALRARSAGAAVPDAAAERAALAAELLRRWERLDAPVRGTLAARLLVPRAAADDTLANAPSAHLKAQLQALARGDAPAAEEPSRRQRAWLAERAAHWERLAAAVRTLEGDRRAPPETLLYAVRAYPEAAGDLATLRRAAPASTAARSLETLYAKLHDNLSAPPSNLKEDLARLFRQEVPAIVRELRARILAIALGFLLAAVAGWQLVATHPDLARLFASEQMLASAERGELWTEGLLNVLPSSVLAAQIFANNIAVTIAAFCLGTFYGLGTLYIVLLNGLMVGSLFSFAAQHGLHGRLLEFIAAHGFVELSVIFVVAAAGFAVGEAIARPGHRTRTAAFGRAVSRGGKLLLPCALLLVGAGLLEGYVSPDARFPLWLRLTLGVGYWFIMAWVLCGLPSGRRRNADFAGLSKQPRPRPSRPAASRS